MAFFFVKIFFSFNIVWNIDLIDYLCTGSFPIIRVWTPYSGSLGYVKSACLILKPSVAISSAVYVLSLPLIITITVFIRVKHHSTYLKRYPTQQIELYVQPV